MDTSPRFALPLIMANQAQKHLTHNEALAQLETLVQPVVQDVAALVPPASPDDMDCVIVGVGATGNFAGRDGAIAAWIADSWHFHTPQAGWVVVEASTQKAHVFDGSAWAPLIDQALAADVAQVGINATASATNRLTVASDATLLTAQSQDHRLTINKTAASDTASMVFQSGWSGRAEMGLAGHDGFAIKVSPDGASWHEALSVDPSNGSVSLPLRPLVTAPLDGGNTTLPAGRLAGFATPSKAQGGFTLGSALTAPASGAALQVPATGTYALTLNLLAINLGAVSVLANGSTLVLSADADLSSSAGRTFQINGLVDLTQGDELALRFDDAATCLPAQDACWVSLYRL